MSPAIGLDRYQPGGIGGDWISTDSIVRDVRGSCALFEFVGTVPDLRRPAVSVTTSALRQRKQGIVARLREPTA